MLSDITGTSRHSGHFNGLGTPNVLRHRFPVIGSSPRPFLKIRDVHGINPCNVIGQEYDISQECHRSGIPAGDFPSVNKQGSCWIADIKDLKGASPHKNIAPAQGDGILTVESHILIASQVGSTGAISSRTQENGVFENGGVQNTKT